MDTKGDVYKGRTIILILATISLVLSAISTLNVAIDTETREDAMVEISQGMIRFIFGLLLWILLYQGRNWARITLIVLYLISAPGLVLVLLALHADALTGTLWFWSFLIIMCLLFLINSGILIFSNDVKSYLSYKRSTARLAKTKAIQRGEFKYNIAFSYAREDEAWASELLEKLSKGDLIIYFDKYRHAGDIGNKLRELLREVYYKESRYCIALLSKNYFNKEWTSFEFAQAFERNNEEQEGYLIPIKIDECALPHSADSLVYVDARLASLKKVSRIILEKVGS